MGFGKYFAGGLALCVRCVYSCLHKPTKGNTMNTTLTTDQMAKATYKVVRTIEIVEYVEGTDALGYIVSPTVAVEIAEKRHTLPATAKEIGYAKVEAVAPQGFHGNGVSYSDSTYQSDCYCFVCESAFLHN